MRTARLAALVGSIATMLSASLSGYFLVPGKWPGGTIVMNLELGSNWDDSAASALAMWNQSIQRVQFNAVRNSSAPRGSGDAINTVFFASDAYGMGFGTDAVAVTIWWTHGTTRVESDVIFNSAEQWALYGGRLRPGIVDLHRVALHEFGHVLGLAHPNEYGQRVVTIMNSVVTDLDTVTPDDIAGAQALYGVAGVPGVPAGGFGTGTVMFPPRDESFDFRTQLEAKYRDGLGRSSTATSVDMEGDIVWTQEYLRYRANRCPHGDAVARTLTQIDGSPGPMVCGLSPVGQVPFPPRNESYEFRTDLERTYQYELGRPPTNETAVDIEGDIVWTQEYLRYRVNGCGHGVAVQSVMVQIDGHPAPPVCR